MPQRAIYATFWGGASYSHSDREDVEIFRSMRAARDALVDRYESNGLRTCNMFFAHRVSESTLFPAVSEGATMTLWGSEDGPESDTAYRVYTLRVAGTGRVTTTDERC